MRSVTRFVANDGTEHLTEGAALKHDALIVACREAMRALPHRDPRLDTNGGKGYVQHDPAAFVEAKRRMLAILAERYPTYQYASLDPAIVHPMSSVGRVASESAEPIARAWGRLCCIDEQAREWEQPFFALHPEKGELVELSAPVPQTQEGE